jgi:hypothetical protein
MRVVMLSMFACAPHLALASRMVANNAAAAGGKSSFYCPCWSLFNGASDCCNRTDDGTGLQFGEEEHNDPVCVPSGAQEHQHCERYCNLRCASVEHPNDRETMVEYFHEKAMEVAHMGPADILMGHTAMKVNTLWEAQIDVNIPVSQIHQLHPVGSWRPRTWNRTMARAAAVIDAVDLIAANGMNITQELTYSQEALAPLQSVGVATAIPFDYCGWSYVFMEGNGRLKGIRLAQEQQPDLFGNDLRMEATLHTFTPRRLRSVHRSIARQWAQYITEAFEEDPATAQGKIDEYMTFRIALVRCKGMEGFDGCPMVSAPGELPSPGIANVVAVHDMVGVQEAKILRNPTLVRFENMHTEDVALKYYKLCSGGYMVGDANGDTVEEYCPECIDIV